jgi:CheY-like chemotaxis protein
MSLGFQVLVIDDDPNTLEILEQYLHLEGYRVVGASDGDEALRILRGNEVDLILLDIQMPKRDGFGTMDEIQNRPEWRDIPVIFLSSFDRPNLKVKALEMGAEDYVTKPFDRAELLSRIKVVLRRSRRFREVETCFHGDLATIPLPVLLQTLSLGSKTARVTLSDSQGWVEVRGGQFIGAGLAEFTGKDALLRLVFGARGSFDIEFEPTESQDQGMLLPIDSLLIEIAPRIDEANQILSEVVDPGARVRIKDGSTLNGASVTLLEALILLPDTLEANARHVIDALSNGQIEPSGP